MAPGMCAQATGIMCAGSGTCNASTLGNPAAVADDNGRPSGQCQCRFVSGAYQWLCIPRDSGCTPNFCFDAGAAVDVSDYAGLSSMENCDP